MSFTRNASVNLVPLLSRLVLAAAFIPAGYDKIMGEPVIYEGRDAQLLQRLGVGGADDETPGDGPQVALYQDDVQTGRLRDRIRPRDDEPATKPRASIPPPTPAPPPRPRPAPPKPPPPEPEPPIINPTPVKPPPVVPPPPPARYDTAGSTPQIVARPLYRVAVMLVNNSPLPEKFKPSWLAWAAAGMEIVGGALILIGLISRFWGLGLAITMAVAFYLTSLSPLLEYGVLNMPTELFNQVFTQLCLFSLALGVTMTGAGGLSIDGLFFGSDYDDEHMLHLG